MTRPAPKRTPYDDAVETELSQWPGVTFVRRVRSKHREIILRFADAERFVVYSGTPSDRSCVKKHLSDIRRTLREMGAERTSAARAVTKPRRQAPKPATPPLRIVRAEPLRQDRDPSRDPWKALEGWAPTPACLTNPHPVKVPRTWFQRIGDTIREWWAA